MGEVVELMLDGVICEVCGVYVGAPVGFPRPCSDCSTDD